MTKVYEFADGKVREHLGGIYDYLSHHQPPSISPLKGEEKEALPQRGSGDGSLSYAEQKALAREQKRKEKALQEAEDKVTQLEAAIRIIEDQLSTPEGSQDVSLYEKHGRLKAQLKQAEEEWEALI